MSQSIEGRHALAFHNTRFNVIDRDGQLWLASAEIAQALGYKDEKSVTRIYMRNTDEFTESMSQVVKLTTSGNYQKTVRIFSLRGAHLIGMFARTPMAQEFRKWVLDVLEREPCAETPEVALARLMSVRMLMVFDLVNGTHQCVPIDDACMVVNPRDAQEVRAFLQLVPMGLLPDVLQIVSKRICGGLNEGR